MGKYGHETAVGKTNAADVRNEFPGDTLPVLDAKQRQHKVRLVVAG
jgi:hypothetical protein